MHWVLGWIRSELWLPWQLIALIGFLWGKRCLRIFSRTILIVLAGNNDMQKRSDALKRINLEVHGQNAHMFIQL